MGFSFFHLVVLLVVVLIVFGAGRLPQVMGDLGKGIRNFKAGMNGEPMSSDASATELPSTPAPKETAKLPPTDDSPDTRA